ncbi:MAG: LacI family DNA-binding transcriptional regulator [Anaerolineae bacterium]|nr:LacI family DNA-binding transcriptional regulator [Anaerolineae bacterium]
MPANNTRSYPNSQPTPRSQNLEDIAAKAGVSRSTVSRVINNEPHVSEKTRHKVLAVIQAEGFTPNPAARALVTQRTQVIGVVIPQVPLILFEDAYYFPTLLQGISRVTNARDYSMLLWLGQADGDEERFYNRIISNRLMDGVIIASAGENYPLIDHFLRVQTPFVLVERPARRHDQNRISYVTIDNIAAAREAVTHLIRLGHTRIGTITGNLAIADGIDRLEGYKQALYAAHLPVDNRLIAVGNFTYHSGYEGAQKLLAQVGDHQSGKALDAIFVASDIMARGVVEALQEAGLNVPDDIALVSFDDLPTAQQVRPPLTSVHHPVEEKGAHAADILIDLIEADDPVPQQIMLPTELIIRQSCGEY